jgi:hypothetical protein
MSGFLGEFGVPSANLAEWLAVQNTALITLRTADVPGAGWFYGANGFYSVNNLNLANTPGDSRLAQILDA